MRDDLLEALAAVDWTVSQLPAFEERIRSWLNDNVYVAIVETELPATHDVMVARERCQLPLDFNIEAGVYINVLRSSLDILATAIGKREMVLNPDSIYFPVTRSADIFATGNYKGSEFVRQLSRGSRDIIEAYQPYHRGNEAVGMIHDLDNMRKHRRLLAVLVRPAMWHVRGWGLGDTFKPLERFPASIEPGKGDTPLGELLKGGPEPDVQFTPHIVFAQRTPAFGFPVVRAIKGFANKAAEIVRAFDF